MMVSFDDIKEEEAYKRNQSLVTYYGKIPSYALFRAEDIGDEESCKNWWISHNNEINKKKQKKK